MTSTARPILFNGTMVRSILSGAKRQTRRVMKPQPEATSSEYPKPGHTWPSKAHQTMLVEAEMQKWTGLSGHACPFGQPGDRLWVREKWMDLTGTGIEHWDTVTGKRMRYAYGAESPPGSASDEARKDFGLKWRPSIHMPRQACRLVLEITGVRVERLQAINDADSLAGGCPAKIMDPVRWFRELWGRTGGNWGANPWVWVISFRQIEDPACS